MIFRLLAFLLGYYRIETAESSSARVADLLSSCPFGYFDLRAGSSGRASFSVFIPTLKKARSVLMSAGIKAESAELRGLAARLVPYRKRFGLLAGLFICVGLCILSEKFVWQIDVTGNEKLTDAQVIEMLKKEGVFEGAYIGGIDFVGTANRFVMNNRELAWAALNVSGNKVECVVSEQKEPGVVEEDTRVSNIVASKAGSVKSIELISGVSMVEEDQTVSKGQLLVSGVNLLRNGKYIYQPAEAVVYAEVLSEVSAECPLSELEKVYTGRVYREKTLVFFTKAKKIFKDSGNLPSDCDRIEKKERIMLFGRIALPLWITTVEYHEFEYEEKTLTVDEAVKKAESMVMRSLADKELISRQLTVTCKDDGVVAVCLYRAIENIAEELYLFEEK